MRTWNDYKEHVKAVDPVIAKDMEETEEIAAIVTAMVAQRNALGLSQRDLAAMCGIPQSSVARIESCKTTPNLGTLLNIFQHGNRTVNLLCGFFFVRFDVSGRVTANEDIVHHPPQNRMSVVCKRLFQGQFHQFFGRW